MAEVIYQVTRFHRGFHGPGHTSLDTVLGTLETKLKRITGPYAFRDKPRKMFDLRGALAEAKKRAPKLDMRERLIIFGQDTGQPAIALRKTEREELESPLVTFAMQFEGKAMYKLGASGPPGDCDCSGLVQKAVQTVFHLNLPRTADTQMNDPRIFKFLDESRLKSGDFVFLNYGRLEEGHADHVEFYVKPGKTIGSRGSTDGVGFYNFDEDDANCVLRYGRLKKEFTQS